jgi:hypothetical protein
MRDLLNRRIVEFHHIIKKCFEVIKVFNPGGIRNIQTIQPVPHMIRLNLLNRQRNSRQKLPNSSRLLLDSVKAASPMNSLRSQKTPIFSQLIENIPQFVDKRRS